MWPEHCVDPLLLAEHDLVVVGGPDTNFWHGALFEPAALEFAVPPSSVPLALDMREPGDLPTYGSRMLTAQLSGSGAVFPRSRAERVELDERLYPTHAMVLACRNPYAAALGRSRWSVFVAEVEQAALRRDGVLQPRQRRRMAPEGLDPHYSESYVPTEVDHLAYDGADAPRWVTLGRLDRPPPGPGAGAR